MTSIFVSIFMLIGITIPIIEAIVDDIGSDLKLLVLIIFNIHSFSVTLGTETLYPQLFCPHLVLSLLKWDY